MLWSELGICVDSCHVRFRQTKSRLGENDYVARQVGSISLLLVQKDGFFSGSALSSVTAKSLAST
jgi:hypothetical protein